ncbi:MAG: UDP-N-acetylglucosamine 1-carboxyvinyltransferase [Lachnospiraceae bacterium]|nr:UDP-N-acetylglucosamine 1-carboxyvinyltransferase [Lachnospiraceae bacterium]
MQGTRKIQGSKNAVLPMIAAAVLCDGITVIENCPDITDVHAMADVIREIGGQVVYGEHRLEIDAGSVGTGVIEEEKVRDIRASVLLLGSLLARFERVTIDYPGGCSIGSRPIDFHITAFQKMGAEIQADNHILRCDTGGSLRGADIELPFPSVGATENIVLAAVLARGDTRIGNAAREPEIVELCEFLTAMGAEIEGAGSRNIRIHGVPRLHAAHWRLGTDRIAFLTYAMMVAGCGGEAFLETEGRVPRMERRILHRLGCQIHTEKNGLFLKQERVPRPLPYVRTTPYPGFPTDGQSLLMAVLCKSSGVSLIEEGIFENRFQMIRQLRKMGANIDYVSNRASITGVTRLHGAHVKADDLRSGAGLLIAAAMADGVTEVENEHYIYRGYEDITGQMRALGLDARVKSEAQEK